MKKETEQAFNTMVEEMRMKGSHYKRYIFMDKDTKSIWSFNTEEQMNNFLSFYLCDEEYKYLTYYNNGKIIVIKED